MDLDFRMSVSRIAGIAAKNAAYGVEDGPEDAILACAGEPVGERTVMAMVVVFPEVVDEMEALAVLRDRIDRRLGSYTGRDN